MEYGLIDHMNKIYSPEESELCFTKPSRKKPEKFILNLKSLTSAFVVLFIGYSISVVVFIAENIAFCYRRNQVIVV